MLTPEDRQAIREAVRALPPLTEEQLDALADVLASVYIDQATQPKGVDRHG